MRHSQHFLLFLLLSWTGRANGVADLEVWSDVSLTKLAFGSCHKRKWVSAQDGIIWEAIRRENPQTFLWTGDAIYPPSRGVASLSQLQGEYQQMLTNETIGYSRLRPPLGIYGTWDDHDYGANDAGNELPSRHQRRQLFQQFLNYSQDLQAKIDARNGLYHSIDFLQTSTDTQNQTQRIKLIVLDTRWNRDSHCIPSVAAKIPLGAAISCLTRWFLAGTSLGSSRFCPQTTTILGEDQWTWLANELQTTTAQIHIIISSIQVLSTNPATEGWGHFPQEQERFLHLLNTHHPSGLILLSGDVHHAEILDPARHTPKQSFLEVTSSGLTHSCTMPFYGALCEPILNQFDSNRRNASDYYLHRNFGTIQIDWTKQQWQVDVQSHIGKTVLTTGWRSFQWDLLSGEELKHVARTIDGHWLPILKWALPLAVICCLGLIGVLWRIYNWRTLSATNNDTTPNLAKTDKEKHKSA